MAAPFALGSDGTVLINVAEFDGIRGLKDAAALARQLSGCVFIGVALTKAEARRVLEQLAHGHREAAAVLVARRRKQGRR